MPKNNLVVSLYGGPGSGKSTVCADLFARLKWKGVNCEMALEYAKDKCWEKSTNTLENQLYVFGKQHHRIWRLHTQVDIVITDSPLLLSLIYKRDPCDVFTSLVFKEYNKFTNINFFINRKKDYNPSGRLQTLEGAKEIDTKIKNLLNKFNIPPIYVDGEQSEVSKVESEVLKRFHSINS